MSRKTKMGRPKSVWNPKKDAWVLHAQQSKVTDRVLAEIMDGLDYPNPVIRLSVADAVLQMADNLREVRKEAALQMHNEIGRTWPEIGSVLGVSYQRAWQIGNGR